MFFVTACQVPRPTTDTTPPEVTVTVSRAHGPNIFRSIDGVLKSPNDCIIVREMPTQLILIGSDAGGVALVGLKALSGRIIPESVEVSPRAPEASYSISTESGADFLDITLTPPSPTTVRTGAVAVLEVNGSLPMAILAWVRDRAGHYVEFQFELRGPETATPCRGGGG